ncbi:MAG TPA: GAF domain-containing protein, partial [Caldithrix abyssi]|nr:GAF domain-containing protein [Caldithrix abyssi]
MRGINIPSKIAIALILFFSLVTFSYDVVQLYSSVTIRAWDLIQEGLSLLVVLLTYAVFGKRPLAKENDVTANLKNFAVLLVALYVFSFLFKQIFDPSFSITTFPQTPDSISSLIYSNLISLAGIILLVPMTLTVRNLIKFKRKKRTNLYFILALIGALVATALTVVYHTPLDLGFNSDMTLPAMVANGAFAASLFFLFLLSFRNSWITYLNRKQKIYFFFASIPISWLVIYIFDFAFSDAVPAHSLAQAAYANLAWLFLVFYSLMSSLNLLLHLPSARVFDRKIKEISSLQNLTRAVSVELDSQKLIRMVAEMGSEILESALIWFELIEDGRQKRRTITNGEIDSQTIAHLQQLAFAEIGDRVIRSGKAVVVNNVLADPELAPLHQSNPRVESLVALPMSSVEGELMGILFAAHAKAFGFDPDDINLLEAFANQASIALENAKLLKHSLERERMEKELQIAREVQLRLLPQTTPAFPGVEIDTLTITAYEVGGDYYDFYMMNEDGFSVFIGDVSGKGTSAAFYMAETKGIIQSLAQMHQSPKEILLQANQILHRSLEKKSFISILAGRFEARANRFRFARAGHCPVVYFDSQKKQTRTLVPNGMAVGL